MHAHHYPATAKFAEEAERATTRLRAVADAMGADSTEEVRLARETALTTAKSLLVALEDRRRNLLLTHGGKVSLEELREGVRK